MNLRRLARLTIEEVSGVDDPANELPGWLLQKNAKVVKADGAAIVPLGDGGFYVVADSWVERLRAEGGDEAITAHFADVLSAFKDATTKRASARDGFLFNADSHFGGKAKHL